MALADGYIGTFETKYHYNYWRPVTAIRLADTDGNPDTDADPDWTPLRQTPPIPDYDSGHAAEGGAAATVLRRFFGTDRIRFSTCSTTLPEGSNCGEAAARVADAIAASPRRRRRTESRGSSSASTSARPWRSGIEHGRRIGELVVDRSMRPTRR